MGKNFNSLVHGDQNPYAAINPADFPVDEKSWGGADPFLDHVIATLRPARVLEIGSWKGTSAMQMAKAACNLGMKEIEIICVDPHVGSAGLWVFNPAAMHKRPNGECGTYDIMLANVKRSGLEHIITPFRATASIAAAIMRQNGLTADLVYIDGNHDEIDVSADLEHSLTVLTPDTGVIICDDYNHPRIQGVTRSVERFLGLRQNFELAASVQTDRRLYTEIIIGHETGCKAVLAPKSLQLKI